MIGIGLLVGLVYVSCLVLATGLLAAGDRVTYQCSGKSTLPAFPRLDEASVDDLSALQASGAVTCANLVNAYIERIYEVNSRLRAISEINPDALSIASSLDAERAAGRTRGPLHGIPILIKDNIATKDLLNNTSGSFALLGATVSREALVVKKLRDAGAVILGKATMGEWAQMRSGRASSSHGWSAYGGQVFGAYYPEQDPSGSSSGSAVAASIGLALGALATETSGSIVLPAEKGNIVGIKPTLGLTSRDMVIPISLRQDSVGPVAKTVKDAAYMLSAISGKDNHDNWTLAQPFDETPDYVKACNYYAFNGARVGVPRNGIAPFLNSASDPTMTAFEKALRLIQSSGANVIDEADFTSFDIDAFGRNSSIVLGTDFAAQLPDYLSQLSNNPHSIKTLSDVVEFTKRDPREEHIDRGIYVWERELERNITNESQESYEAYRANLHMAEELGVVGTLDRYNLDALVMPTFASFHLPAIAGLPIVTVPLGFYPPYTPLVKNLKGTMVNVAPNVPFGLAFIGRRWSEAKLIGLAYAFEQRTMARTKMRPYVNPTFELGDQLLHESRHQTENIPTSDKRRSSQSETMQAIVSRILDGFSRGRKWSWTLLGRVQSLL